MSNQYKDEKGHFTNKENDRGPCKHSPETDADAYANSEQFRKDHENDFDNDYDFDKWDDEENIAEHLLYDPGEYINKNSIEKLNRLMAEPSYKVGTMENLIVKELSNGKDYETALSNAIVQLDEELFG